MVPFVLEPIMAAMMPFISKPLPRQIRDSWAKLTLAHQFAIAGSAVLMAGMLVIGLWVTDQIAEGVTRNTAAATALYVDSVIAPLLPDIVNMQVLPEVERRALDETLSQGALGRRLASFKIWKEDGLIAYSSRPELVGKRFEPTENLRTAWSGHVAADFDELNDDEDRLERAENVPLLEIYSPIREPWSGKVVAVAEFYEIANDLQSNLLQARLTSWLLVAAVTLCMMGLLFGIVLRGSRTIAAQRQALEARIAELSVLLRQNEELRSRVQRASSRSAALNERYLKRISADLHDGPAQLVAYAALRLDSAKLTADAPAANSAEMASIRSCLDEAMQEIRNICRGLTLPHIERMELRELLQSAINAHEQRTGTSVAVHLPADAPPLSQSEKICIFRFVQEALNNAYRHAGGKGQSVNANIAEKRLTISVTDEGPGVDVEDIESGGLGLAGLRERVESLGGVFRIESSSSGTRLEMILSLEGKDTDE